MATIHLPRSLVTLFAHEPPRHLDLEVDSLAALVAELDRRWPGMSDRLLEPPGPQIREHINVFIDGERQRDLATPLSRGSIVHVIPAVAGG
jgi:molybdopterin converting factor small subunit